MSNCNLVSGVSSADDMTGEGVAQIFSGTTAMWAAFQQQIAGAISDPDWKNISWIPSKLSKLGGAAEVAGSMIYADEGERIAAGMAAGTGGVASAGVGIVVAAATGMTAAAALPIAAVVGLIGSVVWSKYAQEPMMSHYKDHVVDPLLTKDSNEIKTDFSYGGYSETIRITKQGVIEFQNNDGVTIKQEMGLNGKMVTTWQYGNVGVGLDEDGNSFVFDNGNSYFESKACRAEFVPSNADYFRGSHFTN